MIIPAEIKNDEFYYSIIELIDNNKNEIKNIIEIGASSGDGSTEAIINGIKNSNKDINLYTLEINKERFENLKRRYENLKFVYPFNYSSVNIDEYMTDEEIINFHNNIKTKLNFYNINMVLEWKINEINYINANNITLNGINKIKEEYNIEHFDLALIDGSAFTGYNEFLKLKNSKFILLDDIDDIKCYFANEFMKKNDYILLKENLNLRNGFSIWMKK